MEVRLSKKKKKKKMDVTAMGDQKKFRQRGEKREKQIHITTSNEPDGKGGLKKPNPKGNIGRLGIRGRKKKA